MKLLITLVFFSIFAAGGYAAGTEENCRPAQSIPELQQRLEKLLRDTHTPGMSVAIARRNGPEWVGGLGKADVVNGRAATADTLFRLGSISKGFAALAILKLADEGKLSLEDPIHKLVPEIWFENPWESTDPIRVVHLLEHTTGWDDLSLRDFAREVPGISVRDALEYDTRSRISRWRPGTRMAYCNSGPVVAAYIVEKLVGERFEDYVSNNFFAPMGMKTATYFGPDPGLAATLYHSDGKTPFPYWNQIYRPAGSINASARDMANCLLFYLNRGFVDGKQVIAPASLDRMENPASTWAAKDGMKNGYGLGNYWTVDRGFVYHGHNGGLSGARAEMNYLPDQGVGYFFAMNTAHFDTYEQAGQIIRAYVTHNLKASEAPPVAPLPADAGDYAGWYEFASTRNEAIRFLDRLAGLTYVHFENDRLLLSSASGLNDVYVAVADRQFRFLPPKEVPDPVASLELLRPNAEGRFIQVGMDATLQRIPTWLGLAEFALTLFVILALVSVLLYAPFWILGGWNRRRRRPTERGLRVWPLVAVLSLVGFVGVFVQIIDDLIAKLGKLTPWSGAVFLLTITFALASVVSAVVLWRASKHEVRTSVRVYSILVTVALLMATFYLAYWGVIGWRTWA